jgi:hypothetical protein
MLPAGRTEIEGLSYNHCFLTSVLGIYAYTARGLEFTATESSWWGALH